jgi:ATP-dependent protease ClpP protease subunit
VTETSVSQRPFASGVFVVRLKGEIRKGSLFSHDVVRAKLAENSGFDHLHLEISSPGGSCDESLKLFNLFRNQPVPVSGAAAGECVSGGLIVLMSAALRFANSESKMLIHPTSVPRESLPVSLTANILSERAEMVADLDDRIVNLFSERTGHSREWFELEKGNEHLLDASDSIQTGVIHDFPGHAPSIDQDWPDKLRAIRAEGHLFPPGFMTTPNYLAACKCACTLFAT